MSFATVTRRDRRALLLLAALEPHTPFEPTASDARWAHTHKLKMLQLVGADERTAFYDLLYQYPIAALVMLSSPCPNWHVGVQAIVYVELLAEHFPEERAYLLDDYDEYLQTVSEFAGYIMDAYPNRVSLYPFMLDEKNEKACSKVEEAIVGLAKHGAQPCAQSPLPPLSGCF